MQASARYELVYTNRVRRSRRYLEEVAMRARLTAASVVILLALATASATGARVEPQAAQADSIPVWLMSDAQSSWPEAVTAANQAFRQRHPGGEVKVQYQTWGDYKTKFEATLTSGALPAPSVASNFVL